jgi:tetratricopeptide (TPR) repeat protein
VITGTELASYVAPAVSSIAKQTPAFGSLPGSEGGEFIFEMPIEREGLSADTGQLDTRTSELNKKLDSAAKPVTTEGSKGTNSGNLQVVVKNLDGQETKLITPAAAALPPRVAAQRANDKGLALYRERRYDEAEAAFTEALKLHPKFPLAANNLGFVYFKRGQAVEAARWFEKSIEMDGSRALAYLNLGDAYLQAGDDAKATRAYTLFVGLSPQHARSAALQAWLKDPDKTKNRPAMPMGS